MATLWSRPSASSGMWSASYAPPPGSPSPVRFLPFHRPPTFAVVRFGRAPGQHAPLRSVSRAAAETPHHGVPASPGTAADGDALDADGGLQMLFFEHELKPYSRDGFAELFGERCLWRLTARM